MREKIRCGRDSGIVGRTLGYPLRVLWATYPGFLTAPGGLPCDAEHISRPNPAVLPARARGRGRPVACVIIFALGLTGAACRFTARDRQAIEGVLAGQVAAWNRGDLEGFMRVYEPSEALVFTSGGAIRRGFAAARARYLERYGARGVETMGHLEFEVVDVRGLGRDSAVVLGRWRLTATAEAGEGVFSLALQRHGDGWYIVHDHTSASAVQAPVSAIGDADGAGGGSEKQPDTGASSEL